MHLFFSFSIALSYRHHVVRNPTNQTAIDAVNMFATDLANRFNPIVGCTRSWDTADPTDFQVCAKIESRWETCSCESSGDHRQHDESRRTVFIEGLQYLAHSVEIGPLCLRKSDREPNPH